MQHMTAWHKTLCHANVIYHLIPTYVMQDEYIQCRTWYAMHICLAEHLYIRNLKAYPQGIYTWYFSRIRQYSTISIRNSDPLCLAHMPCSTFVYHVLKVTTRHIHKTYIHGTSLQYDNIGSAYALHICLGAHLYIMNSIYVLHICLAAHSDIKDS